MKKKIFNKKAFSVIEYVTLLVILIGAFLVMRNYIQRGIYGAWGQSGQSFGFGRQYDAQKTVECGFDGQYNVWYDRNCFKTQSNHCQGDTSCDEGVITSGVCTSPSCNASTQ